MFIQRCNRGRSNRSRPAPRGGVRWAACCLACAAAVALSAVALDARVLGRGRGWAAAPAARAHGASAEDSGFNWDKLTQEATALLSQYIRIDTSNPPGNELGAARMLREKFLADGIPATVWEPAPGRGVVAARLRGIGKHTKAIILLSHMDVVPAVAKQWQVPPFSGEVKDGDIWGRGAIDDKGPGVIEMMAMLAIKRAGILLDRDIIFIATGDEEAGGRNGAEWFVNHEKQVFSDAGYLLNEGGGIEQTPGHHRYYAVSIAE